MQRFFFNHTLFIHDININKEDFVHQVSRVLRSVPGDTIILFNGDGKDYVYEITTIAKKDVSLTFKRSFENIADPIKTIRLYQALPNKYEKIEYILQKGVEVGIQEFVFFIADRSQKLVINERKVARFMDIAREALEQCGGNKMPSIRFETKKIFPLKMKENIFVLHTANTVGNAGPRSLRDKNENIQDFSLFVGPEGGWSDAEIIQFQNQNATFLSCGQRILRTETAGVVSAFYLLN